MPLSISQALAISYPAVLADKKLAANQWSEATLLGELEKQGAIEHESLGPTIEAPLDYQRNPDAAFLATDLQTVALNKTEVITSASYTPAQISIPATWSKMDEAQNTTDTQKIKLVSSLIRNVMDSHDDLLEQYLFATSTNGFLGLVTHIPATGQSSSGGIDSTTYTWWRSQFGTYVDDTDIEATFTTVWNACSKGSGSKLQPTLMVSDGATQSLFEGTQQANQRWGKGDELNAGFKVLKFKNANYIFSLYGGTSVYFLNPKNFKLIVSKQYFRDKSETQELQNANGFTFKVYSALQTITNNRSRLGVAKV